MDLQTPEKKKGTPAGAAPTILDAPRIMCMVCIVKSADLIRELKAAGWVQVRVRGSHHVFRHPNRPGHLVVPHPKKDLGTGLVAAIRKQAGL